ncbi:MAG TPA: hypothetical protein VGD84_00725 [Pseudonocardiaceae bacterium]
MTGSIGSAWQVDPSQVQAFARAVQQVRDNLNAVRGQVDQLAAPAYQPMLGTSPVGQALTAKFTDRVTGGEGLLAQLDTTLAHLDQFVATAEQAAANYVTTDTTAAESLRAR